MATGSDEFVRFMTFSLHEKGGRLNGIDGYPTFKNNEQACRHLSRLYFSKKGLFDER